MIPTVPDVLEYLGPDTEWSEDVITAALTSEMSAQAARCRIPVDETDPEAPVLDYPPDLAEALYRRVAANLANRALPLGLQSAISEVGVGFVRTGGGDREVARLEAPYRRLVVG